MAVLARDVSFARVVDELGRHAQRDERVVELLRLRHRHAAVLLAHELARRSMPSKRALVLSQLPLAAVMVGYTLFGLWLLSTPAAG